MAPDEIGTRRFHKTILGLALPWLLGALVALGSTTALARPNLLQPSARALAQGDDPPVRRAAPVVKEEAPRRGDADQPLYKKWWFWALTAAVVGGTVALGVATFDKTESLPKP